MAYSLSSATVEQCRSHSCLLTQVSALSVRKPDPMFVEYEFERVGSVEPHMVHYVKGWTRAVALHLCCALLWKSGHLAKFLEDSPAEKLLSFASIVASPSYSSAAEAVDLNRGGLLNQ